jgi:hypothetical protein
MIAIEEKRPRRSRKYLRAKEALSNLGCRWPVAMTEVYRQLELRGFRWNSDKQAWVR